ncbi:MAG: T9SS type A sorting domain-containing protein [Chitinophagales bacterium]
MATCQADIPYIQWIKSYGGSLGDGFLGNICQTKDGNMVMVGTTNSYNGDAPCSFDYSIHGFIVKTDRDGNRIYSHCFGSPASPDGFILRVNFWDVAPTADSGCIVATEPYALDSPSGTFPYACDSTHIQAHLGLMKFDKNGLVQWRQCYGGGGDDELTSVCQAPDGGYYFLAQTRSATPDFPIHYGGPFDTDCWLVKTDSLGTIQWQKLLGGSGDDHPKRLHLNEKNQIVTLITTNSTDHALQGIQRHSNIDSWVCIFDSAGALIKQAVVPYNGSDSRMFDFCVKNSGFYFSGFIAGDNGGNQCHPFSGQQVWPGDNAIFALDSNLNYLWCYIGGGSDIDRLFRIAPVNDHLFAAIGSSYSTELNQFCGLPFIDSLTTEKWSVFFIDDAGHLKGQRCFSGSKGAVLSGLMNSDPDELFISGSTASTDYDFTDIFNRGDFDGILIKMKFFPDDVSHIADVTVQMAPNPTSDVINVSIPHANRNMKLLVKNALGETLWQQPIFVDDFQINLTNFSSGIYFFHLENGTKHQVLRVVKY